MLAPEALHSCREWRLRSPCRRDVAALALPAVVLMSKRPGGRAPQPNSLQGAAAQAPAHCWEHQTSRLSCSGQKRRIDATKLNEVARSAQVAYMVGQFRVISDDTQGNSCSYQFSEHAGDLLDGRRMRLYLPCTWKNAGDGQLEDRSAKLLRTQERCPGKTTLGTALHESTWCHLAAPPPAMSSAPPPGNSSPSSAAKDG